MTDKRAESMLTVAATKIVRQVSDRPPRLLDR
jgi:hypothetical protein